jgi:hypothetical protein
MLINYRCQCGTECSEEELITACTFHATREEPAEYEAFCPSGCGTNADDMEEVIADDVA